MNVSHDSSDSWWVNAPSERAATDAIVELAEARRREQQVSPRGAPGGATTTARASGPSLTAEGNIVASIAARLGITESAPVQMIRGLRRIAQDLTVDLWHGARLRG